MVMVKPALAYLDVIAAGPGRGRRAARRVPRVRRVRDGQGRGRAGLDRRRRGRARAPHRHQAGRRRHRSSPTSPASSPRLLAVTRAATLPGVTSTDGWSRAMTNAELFERGLRVIPGGRELARCGRSGRSAAPRTSSPGPRVPDVWDVEGTRATSTTCSATAPSILGHAHPAVVEAVQRRPRPTARPTARRPRARCCWPRRSAPGCPARAGAPRVTRGTEATMSAIRLARGATGRDRDREVRRQLPRARRRPAGRGRRQRRWRTLGPARLGGGHRRRRWPTPWSRPTTWCPTLDDDGRRGLRRAGGRQHGPGRRRSPGFLEGLRAECDRVGALLVFDEVITGFRVGPRRRPGAASGSRPTSACFGKVIGGGLPVGAFGGRRRGDGRRSPRSGRCTRPARCRGTRWPPPPAWPCSTSSTTTPTPLIAARADCLAGALADACLAPPASPPSSPVAARWSGSSSAPSRPARLRRGVRHRRGAYAAFFHAMLDRGVALAPGAYEVMFPGLAHDDAVLTAIAEAATRAAVVAASA